MQPHPNKQTEVLQKIIDADRENRRPVQLSLDLPGIEYTPEQVRRHGLQEAHTFPLVSSGKGRGGGYSSFRVHASQAWDFASLELRSATAWPVLVLDCDGASGYPRIMLAVQDREVPLPNWIVHRVSGGAHLVYTLERPVLRGATARQRPLRRFARVSEYLAQAVGADAGYNGVLSHNPMIPDLSQGLQTDWLREQPYPIDELGEVVPFGWKRPGIPRTEVGRNCAMFEAGMKWAGSPANLALSVLPALMSIYREIVDQYPDAGHPFPASEVEGIARSIERYRRQWIERGRFYTKAERQAWGRERGIRSGQARRKRLEARDREIVGDRIAGLSIRIIARKHNLAGRTVHHILSRDVPLLVRGVT